MSDKFPPLAEDPWRYLMEVYGHDGHLVDIFITASMALCSMPFRGRAIISTITPQPPESASLPFVKSVG